MYPLSNPILRGNLKKTIPDLLQPLPAQEVCGCLELAREEQPGFHGIVVQSHLLVPVRVPLQFTSISHYRRKIKLIEKHCHLKKLTCEGTLRQVFICLKTPALLGFCLG
jgi:hypothetical protein